MNSLLTWSSLTHNDLQFSAVAVILWWWISLIASISWGDYFTSWWFKIKKKLNFLSTHAYSREEQWHCDCRALTDKFLLFITSLLILLSID